MTFAEFVSMVSKSLAAFRLPEYVVEVIRPTNNTAKTLANVRQALATNEATDHDIILAYFNQGVLTGDWDGPHISPIAAYDQETRQVLIMDVDREWYVPYWTTDTKLLEAMLRPAPAAHGRLAGTDGRSRLDQACIIAMSKLTPAALMPRTHGRRADRAIRNGLALCCVAALRAHGPRWRPRQWRTHGRRRTPS